jgi:hypothetical protein
VRTASRTTVALAVVAVVVAALAVNGWYALTTAFYVNHVSGVWLGLADDLARGVFYRELIGPAGYGGTRYFPLFFSAVAALMKAGLSPLAAGFAISLLGGVLLAGGAGWAASRLGLPRDLVAAVAMFTLAAPFVQQTMFSIRSDVLATGLVALGLAAIAPAWRDDAARRPWPGVAAVMFTLAVAAKITTLYAPAAAVTSLVLCRRRQEAARLVLFLAGGAAVLGLVLTVGSGGRAIESFRACALGGDTAGAWLAGGLWSTGSVLFGPSRFLGATLGLAIVAWLAGLRRTWRGLPSILLACAVGSTSLVLASPGTIYTNQMTDVYLAAILVIAAFLARHVRFQATALVVLLVLAAGAARVNVSAWWSPEVRRMALDLPAERRQLSDLVGRFRSPVLTEAPELAVLAGTRPIVLDPFSLRVVMLGRPEVAGDLARRIDAREFSAVVLMHDPGTAAGRGWYTNVELGWPIVERILANYRMTDTAAGFRVYRPVAAPETVR